MDSFVPAVEVAVPPHVRTVAAGRPVRATEWNYGPGWEETLLDAYGIERDPPRISYYRLLWELCP